MRNYQHNPSVSFSIIVDLMDVLDFDFMKLIAKKCIRRCIHSFLRKHDVENYG